MANKRRTMRTPPRYLIEYVPPGRRKAQRFKVGPRQLEMLELLAERPATRLDMLRRGRPRIALNATSTIRALRNKGFYLHSQWQVSADGDYRLVRFVEYQLKGRLVSSEPIFKGGLK